MRALLAIVLLGSACTGIVDTSGPGGGSDVVPDAGPGSNTPDGGTTPTDAPAFACRNPVTNVGSGNHNAGQDCMNGCHNHGFTLAGTLFVPNTTTPVVGASITVVDGAGKTFDIVSQRNGNFYTSTTVTFPVHVTASRCPDVMAMSGAVAAGGCNQTGCHASGAQGSIHLP
jgi:hypothetical protein